jgi:DNA-binding HxlR family transcriptional regulator
MNAHDHTFCPVYDSIQLLQEKWVLHIVRALLEGPHGFNDLARAVGGVNTTTLSARLEHLERVGVVVKTIESTMPPRTRYELSVSGRALQQVVDAIDAWARAHMPACRAAEAAETGAAAGAAATRSGAGHPAHE